MATLTLLIEGSPDGELDVRRARITEEIRKATEVELEAFAKAPVDAATMAGKSATLVWDEATGSRAFRGIVVRFTAIATGQRGPERKYKLLVRSTFAAYELNRRYRVFQHMTAPDIVKKVLTDGGWAADAIDLEIGGSHDEREYVVHYDESGATFVRRMCEDDGLYFVFRATEDAERFVLADDSRSKKPTLEGPITVVDEGGLDAPGLLAARARVTRRRAVGKVTLRDYDPTNPPLKLEGVAEDGNAVEKATEVYLAPGRFADNGAGEARAKLRLEAFRATTRVVTFETNVVVPAPGDAIELALAGGYVRAPRFEGLHFVIRAEHGYEFGKPGTRTLETIPLDVPYRLPHITPRPRVAGVQQVLVTGPAGSEIHPDADGNIFIRFHWDREGPTDDKSSLPVRPLQPNMPGSMVLPRVGWELAAGFEDGDPDRPYVLGRVFNAAQPPPVALPANKTMTRVESVASPGGGRTNAITFDDAAGRQHVMFDAGFGLTVDVANNQTTQTKKVEKAGVVGSQTRKVGGTETLAVTEAYRMSSASQSATVGGMQKIFVKGNYDVKVGSELVVVGGALLEKIGNPVTGLKNLGVAAALAGVGALGDKVGGLGGKVIGLAGTGAGVGWSMYQAATAPGAGPNAARDAGIRGVLGFAAGTIPGGDSLLASATSLGMQFPWEKPPEAAGAAVGGGGAGPAVADAAAAAGPGPGHRNEKVSGAMAEIIGAAHGIITPGEIKLQVTGASLFGVGASHTSSAVKAGTTVLGARSEVAGSHHLKAKVDIVRETNSSLTTKVGGAFRIKASQGVSIKTPAAFRLTVGGALTLVGSKVTFVVGESTVSSSPGGVLIKAATITFKKKTTQSGTSSHT